MPGQPIKPCRPLRNQARGDSESLPRASGGPEHLETRRLAPSVSSRDAEERERERERCDSAKLAHLASAPRSGASTLTTYLPAETTPTKLPLRKPTRSLSRKTPDALGTVDHNGQTQTRPYVVPGNHSRSPWHCHHKRMRHFLSSANGEEARRAPPAMRPDVPAHSRLTSPASALNRTPHARHESPSHRRRASPAVSRRAAQSRLATYAAASSSSARSAGSASRMRTSQPSP
jgi:hypothetical protein